MIRSMDTPAVPQLCVRASEPFARRTWLFIHAFQYTGTNIDYNHLLSQHFFESTFWTPKY